jgi:hypothetical protein
MAFLRSLVQTAVCVLALGAVACQHPASLVTPPLPSRPLADLFPRGASPPPDCPGQYRIVMENKNGNFFMGCWGTKTD